MANIVPSVFGLVLVAGMSLGACSKSEQRDDIHVPESPVVSGPVEDQFGKKFGEAFRADPNSEPTAVSDNDVPPLSLTTEPVQID